MVSGANVKQYSTRNERAVKGLTVLCFLLIVFLVSGQQPLQDAFRKVWCEIGPRPEGDPRLLLTGIFLGPRSTAVINGRVLAERETATIPSGSMPLTITVLRLDRAFATVAIKGEKEVRVLACR